MVEKRVNVHKKHTHIRKRVASAAYVIKPQVEKRVKQVEGKEN